jgi:hypothetical protein
MSASDPLQTFTNKGSLRAGRDFFDMSIEPVSSVFVQRLSIWKTLAVELVLIAGAVVPLTPHFSDGLVYTAFLYQIPFLIYLVCGCLGLIAVVFLLLIWRALCRTPVLTITDRTITALLATRTRTIRKSDVVRVVRIWPGANINLEVRGGRPLGLPVWFYEEPALVMERLEPLAANRPELATKASRS